MTVIPRRRQTQVTRSDNRVLFVDDEEGVLVALQHMVAETDLAPMVASSGAAALEMLATHGPVALVLSDYRMPGMTGVDLLREVHLLYPKTRRLILSGYAETHAVMEAINEGHVDRFLAKPWNDQKLVLALVEAVNQYRKEIENERMVQKLEERNLELERLPYALYGFDSNRRLVAVNELGRAFANTATPPSVGDSLASVLPPAMVPIVDEAISFGQPKSGTVPASGLSYDLEFVALGAKRCVMVLLRRL